MIENPKQLGMSWKLTMKIRLCVIAGNVVFRTFLLRRVDCFKSCIENKMSYRIFLSCNSLRLEFLCGI